MTTRFTRRQLEMVDIDVWRARIGLFNLRAHRSDDGRVKDLSELLVRLCRRAKKRCVGETANGEEEEQGEVKEEEQKKKEKE